MKPIAEMTVRELNNRLADLEAALRASAPLIMQEIDMVKAALLLKELAEPAHSATPAKTPIHQWDIAFMSCFEHHKKWLTSDQIYKHFVSAGLMGIKDTRADRNRMMNQLRYYSGRSTTAMKNPPLVHKGDRFGLKEWLKDRTIGDLK